MENNCNVEEALIKLYQVFFLRLNSKKRFFEVVDGRL